MWDPIINLLQGVLAAAGGLGLLIGVALKAVAGPDENKHAMSHKLIGASLGGVAIAAMAQDIYNLIFSWI